MDTTNEKERGLWDEFLGEENTEKIVMEKGYCLGNIIPELAIITVNYFLDQEELINNLALDRESLRQGSLVSDLIILVSIVSCDIAAKELGAELANKFISEFVRGNDEWVRADGGSAKQIDEMHKFNTEVSSSYHQATDNVSMIKNFANIATAQYAKPENIMARDFFVRWAAHELVDLKLKTLITGEVS